MRLAASLVSGAGLTLTLMGCGGTRTIIEPPPPPPPTGMNGTWHAAANGYQWTCTLAEHLFDQVRNSLTGQCTESGAGQTGLILTVLEGWRQLGPMNVYVKFGGNGYERQFVGLLAGDSVTGTMTLAAPAGGGFPVTWTRN